MKELFQKSLKDRALTVDRLIEEVKLICLKEDKTLIGLDANLAESKLIATLSSIEKVEFNFRNFNPVTSQFVFA